MFRRILNLIYFLFYCQFILYHIVSTDLILPPKEIILHITGFTIEKDCLKRKQSCLLSHAVHRRTYVLIAERIFYFSESFFRSSSPWLNILSILLFIIGFIIFATALSSLSMVQVTFVPFPSGVTMKAALASPSKGLIK